MLHLFYSPSSNFIPACNQRHFYYSKGISPSSCREFVKLKGTQSLTLKFPSRDIENNEIKKLYDTMASVHTFVYKMFNRNYKLIISITLAVLSRLTG